MSHSAQTAKSLVLALVIACLATAARAGDDQALDELLTRLNLGDLRLHHMERMLEREPEGEKRLPLARRLADAYAEHLIAAVDDAPRFAAIQAKVERLLEEVPEARTPSVEVVLLQADYQRAEALMIRWLDAPADRAPLAEAESILARIAPLLTMHQKDLNAAADKTAEEMEELKSEHARAAAEQQMSRQQAVASRAGYFAAWSNYYLGVARQNAAAAQPHFTAAKEQFCVVLDVTDEKNYEPVEVDGLGLDSIWRSRAVIGLGLAELALNRPAAAAKVFSWLDHASAPPQIRDQAGYWHVQGMLNVGQYAAAGQLVETHVEGFTGSPSPGKNSLCIAAVRAGAALDATKRDERQRLVEQGIRGLARMRQFETLDKLIEKHDLAAQADASSFYLTWLRGRQQFLAAEKTKAAADFQAAAKTLTTALAHPQARRDLTDAGQARYYLGWSQYRLDDLQIAARSFQEAATALKSSLAEVAAQAAWMQCTCLMQLSQKDKKFVAPAIAALQNLKQDFPASEQAGRAELLITRLRQSHSSPEEAIRELAKLPPGDPNYVSAHYEICQLKYQLWAKAKADARQAGPLAADVLKAADTFLAGANKDGDWERRLKATLLAVDVLSADATANQSRIAALLRDAADTAENIAPSNPAAVEYHYRRLQLAQKTGDQETVNSAAQFIAANGSGSPFELPALVVAARAADAAAESASEPDRAARQEEAARVYARLVELLGDSPTVLATSKNALAASSKLAQYDEALGRWPQAADRLERLVEALPSDRRFLRRAGIATFQTNRHADSLEHWRKLLAGLSIGSEEWLEAKYHQLACLLQTDRPAADKVWKQFKLLFPQVKSAAWKDKFAELEKQFS
jgi:hypothetical protein